MSTEQTTADEAHEEWWAGAPKITFEFRWDADANVWVITSPEISGLTTEAQSLPEGLRRAADVVPYLIENVEGIPPEALRV